MLNKIKGMTTKTDSEASKVQNDESTVQVDGEEQSVVAKESFFGGAMSKTMSGVQSAKDSLKDFSIMDKVNSFCAKSVDIVTTIDQHLAATNSVYEVGNFKVNASAGLSAGMSLDINFIKTPAAKALKQTNDKFLQITNPKNNNTFKIPRAAVAGKSQAKVKDPTTGEIIMVNTTTGKVIEQS